MFCRQEGVDGEMPHVLADMELTTQLWIRSPARRPTLPRKVMIADSFAALNPGQRFWDRCVEKTEALKQQGVVTDGQVAALIFSTTARSALSDKTLGDPERLGTETITEVLDEFRDELARPVVEAAQAEFEAKEKEQAAALLALEAQRDANVAALATLQDKVAEFSSEVETVKQDNQTLAATLRERDARDARVKEIRRERVRWIVFSVPAGLFLLGGAMIALLATGLSQLLSTLAICGCMVVALLLIAVGYRDRSLAWKGWVAIGGVITTFAFAWAAADRPDGKRSQHDVVPAEKSP
jgi:hypothetical protein